VSERPATIEAPSVSRQSGIILALWVLTIAFCIALVANWLPWLRGDVPWLTADEKWIWRYGAPRWLWVLPCALGIAIYVLGVIYLLERERESRYPLRLILWAFGGAVLLPLLLMTMEGRPLFLLFTRTASTVIGGYQYAANLSTDLGATLRNWPQFVIDYRKQVPLGGIALSPPGLLTLFYGATKGFEAFPPLASTFDALVRPLQCQNLNMMTWAEPQMASAWIQMGMPLWAATAVAPLYALGRSIFNRRTAQWAVALWPLVPGLDIFDPRFNVFYPLMALVMLVFLWRGLDRKRAWLVGLAGFGLSVGMFANLSLIPLGLLAGLTTLGHWLITPAAKRQFGRLVGNLAAFGLGSISVWAIYSALSGVSIVEVYRQGFAFHSILNRPYGPWLILHTYDTFLWIGLPVAALAIWRILRIRREPSRADVFAGSIALTMTIMVLSGTARGETGRVWLFFAGIWLLLAADVALRLKSRQRVAVVVMEGLCLFSMAAVLRANFTELTVVPWPPTADHSAAFPINAQFVRGSDAVTFVGLSVDKSSTAVALELHWRADTFVQRPYVLSLVSVPPDHSKRESLNWTPLKWDYPPSCWLPGQEFIDTVTVPLGANPPPGDWLFSLSISDVFTHEPMVVAGQNTTQIGIGPVNISAP
jgi:hypothetical protein